MTHSSVIESEKLTADIFKVISQMADSLNMPCYVVGGYVRDIFLNRQSKDIDVVVEGSGIVLAEALSNQLGRGANVSVFKNFGTAQLKYKETEVEFVGARKESYQRDSRKPIVEDGTLTEDLSRRDFTINAMAISLNKSFFGQLVDLFDGMSDLENRIIRTPLDADITFSDDPLRMMRAIRFASQLNFEIDLMTYQAIARNKERITIISKERIADELNKIILSAMPSRGFFLLEQCGLLALIFPELQALIGVESVEGRGHKDNFRHTLQVLDQLALKSNSLWLRWSALLHDIAKPVTKRYDKHLGWTFHNHNYVGMKMVPHIFRRMKLPMNEKMKYVQALVELHMRPINLAEEEVTDSAIRRLLFDAGDNIEDLMLLCEADITSKNQKKVQRILDNFALVRVKLKEIEEKDRIRNMQPPIDGQEIMQVFNLSPCNIVGEIKAAIKDAILDGRITNDRDAAYQFMIEIAKKKGLTPQETPSEG